MNKPIVINHAIDGLIPDSERRDFKRAKAVMEHGGSIADWWTSLISYTVGNELDEYSEMVY